MSSNLADKVKKLFQGQIACSQATFVVYGEHLGLGKVDKDTCMKIASAFSGGIAQTGNVCGALTGALMALGLKYGGKNWEKVDDVSKELLKEFKSLNGSILCRELINHDLNTAEDIKQAFEKGTFNNCQKFVDDVSMMLDKLI